MRVGVQNGLWRDSQGRAPWGENLPGSKHSAWPVSLSGPPFQGCVAKSTVDTDDMVLREGGKWFS